MLLKRQGVIGLWDAEDITAGTERIKAINNNLKTADIILLLISSDFIASDYCYETELQQALERHCNGEACVIPIILRSCDWQSAPFGKLQALPSFPGEGVKPISTWSDRDGAFLAIVEGIRKIVREFKAVPATSEQEDWIEEVRSRCCKKIFHQHGTIQLLNQKEIGVDQLYVDVWLLEKPLSQRYVSAEAMLESFDLRNDRIGLGDRIRRNEGMTVAKQYSKLMILGKPGSGKTTFLKHLAVNCSRRKIHPNLIPVLIELRQIRSEDWKLMTAISKQMELSPKHVERLLDQGKLLVLMDGLDEVPTEQLRRNVQDQVQSFSRKFGIQEQQLRYVLSELNQVRKEHNYQVDLDYQKKLDEIFQEERNLASIGIHTIQFDEEKREFTIHQVQELIDKAYVLCGYNRFILTCRTQIGAMPQGFEQVEIADFNDEQVEKFVKNWLQASGQNKLGVDRQWRTFKDVIEKNTSFKELTVTPVLLSLICLVLQDQGNIPSQIPLLYRKGIRLLLEKWNDRKDILGWEVGKEVYRQLSVEQKEALLTEIAVRKFEDSNDFALFEQSELAGQIATFLKLTNQQEGEDVMRAIETQHGLLVERANELWSFSHLTFQEHLAIEWLINLTPKQLAEKIAHYRWREVVIRFIKSQLPVAKLLQMIKKAIDYSISEEPELQEFLIWVETVSKCQLKDLNELPVARAHYFDFALNLDNNLADDPIDLAHNLNLAHDLDRDLDVKLAVNLPPTFAQDLARARDLAQALFQAYHFSNSSPDSTLKTASVLVDTLQHLCAKDLDPNSLKILKKLKLQLAYSSRNWNSFKKWWHHQGQICIEEMKQGRIGNYDIGRKWHFTRLQRRILNHYCNNHNRFLVELLREHTTSGLQHHEIHTVLQEVEDNLLLPITTLQERLPQIYFE